VVLLVVAGDRRLARQVPGGPHGAVTALEAGGAVMPLSLPTEIAQWVGEATGGELVKARRLPGGNRRQAWLLDVHQESGGPERLFLRFDPSEPNPTVEPHTLWREAAVYRALMRTDVRIPRLVAVHPTIQAFVTERAEGSAAYHLASDAVRRAVARDFMHQLGRLHRIAPGALELAELGAVRSPDEELRSEVQTWERLYRDTGRSDPLIEFGFSWLVRHTPELGGPVVLVHGDAGPSNFIFADTCVTAVIDWEFAHFGDPMEDLAWLSMRSMFQPIPDFPARLREYETESGISIDLDRIRFYRILVQLKVAVIRHRDTGNPDSNSDVAMSLMSRAVNRRALVEALADLAGLSVEPAPAARALPTERTWIYESLLQELRDVIVPLSSDDLVVAKAKSAARVIKYLERVDRLQSILDDEELRDLSDVLGHEVASLQAGRDELAVALREYGIPEMIAVRLLSRQAARDIELIRPALGALMSRHLPRLDAAE